MRRVKQMLVAQIVAQNYRGHRLILGELKLQVVVKQKKAKKSETNYN